MIEPKVKLTFFDRQSVTDKAEKAKLRNLSKFGAFVMRSARQSIKDKPGPSQPGTPPHAHTYSEVAQVGLTKSGKPKKPKKFYPFRSSILFGYDKSRDSVVVGPQFRMGSRRNPTIPNVLEFGGIMPRFGKPKRIRRRPFMAPALEKEMPKFVGLFKGSIGG